MLIKINLDNETFAKIKALISEGKYEDLYHFIEIAISNQIQEETAGLSGVTDTDRISLLTNSLQRPMEFGKEDIIGKEGWKKKLREIKLEESAIEPNKEDLIWSFYNRFLPVKIVIYELGILMIKYSTWIELDQLKDYSYELAREISKILKEYEDKFEVPRNRRLSTGLPTPLSELEGLKGAQKRKKENKLLSSQARFMEQFVGRKTSGDNPDFHGAGFSMGLIGVKFVGNTCYVSLTKNGREFALLNNPVIDGEQKDVAFFNDEVNFIMENVIPRFPLEKIIINKILEELKRRPLTSNDINEIFKEEKEKYLRDKHERTKDMEDGLTDYIITQERVSTMGRLSELGLVKWNIDKTGQSLYSLKTINS